MAFLSRLCLFFALILIAGSSFLSESSAAQGSKSSWLKSEPINMKTISPDVPADALLMYTNNECLPNTKFITRPRNILKGFTESSYLTCAVQTAFGFQSASTGDVRLNKSELAGSVRTSGGGILTTTAIPQSQHLMYLSGGFYGSHRYIVRDFAENSNVVIQSDGSIQHRLKPGVNGSAIKDAQGSTLDFKGFRFSKDGRWAVGDVPFRGLARVNIETGETLMFGDGYDYSKGIQPIFVYSISADGRYVLASEPVYGILKIYDLAACLPTTDPVKKNCPYKDLFNTVKAANPGYSSIHHAHFSTNYSIRVYVRSKNQSNQLKYSYQLWTAPGEQESGLEYLALGDSFASGEGAYNYKPGTDIENPFNKCHLSALSYPYLLGGRAGLNSVESVACSGAKMKDISTTDILAYNRNQKQSEGKELSGFDDQIYSNFLVGYRPQHSFVEKNKPLAVTLSISGNDIGFGKVLFSCLMPGTCYKTEQERLNLTHTINSKFDELVSTYRHVKNGAASQAKIYVMGYPSLADPDGNCALNVHLNREEIIFSNQIISHLNNVVQRAASKAGVSYISVKNAFRGKRLCETLSSEIAVNGLTAGDDKTLSVPLKLINESLDVYLTGRESYHPNQLGHQLYANTIFESTDGFKLNDTSPNYSEQAPPLENPHNLALSKIQFDDSLSDTFLLSGQSGSIEASGLRASSNVFAYLNSEPISPGGFRTDHNGTLLADFEVPNNTVPGVYTLSLTAQSTSGENVDIQKLVYIAASEADIDGDGVPNDKEKCILVEASLSDQDIDGIDDACDSNISKAASSAQSVATVNNSPSSNTASPESSGQSNKNVDYAKSPERKIYDVLGSVNPPHFVQKTLNSIKIKANFQEKRKGFWLFVWAIGLVGLLVWSFYRQRKKR
jgi:hypothetical protein